MLAFGFAEILVLLLGGMNTSDLVAVVQPKDYFESRNVRMSVDSMIDLAIRDPKDGKAQFQQLLALRYMTDESAAFKKAANYASNREAIEEIAAGKRAQDKAGFAKEYAQRLLDKLDGKKVASPKLQPMRADAFDWFPADVTWAGALDLRGNGVAVNESIQTILKMMPAAEKQQMYAAIEKIGNVRIERIAFAYADDGDEKDPRVFIRVTGKGSHEGLLRLFNELDNGGRLAQKQLKVNDGTKITLLQEANDRPPVIMLVGNTDLLVVGTNRPGQKTTQGELVQAVLDLRDKKKPSAAGGPFKARLAKLPADAVGFMVGEFPTPMKRTFENEFGGVPSNGLAYLQRSAQGLDLHAEASMKNADDADKVVKKIADLRKEGIAGLQKAMQQPLPAGAPPVPFQALINVLDTMQVQSQKEKINVRVSAPSSLLQQIPMIFLMGRSVELKKAG